MCGINVIFGKNLEDYKTIFRKMMDKLKHRGDSYDPPLYLRECFLGTQRLKILDRDNAIQPMMDNEKDIYCVLNGEIYNSDELREDLQEHYFKTKSDAEILIYGFKKWGDGLVNKIEGQFAFVIYDLRNNSIFAARDPFGIKPLHYSFENNVVAFSSELKSIQEFSSGEIFLLEPGTFYKNGKNYKYFEFENKKITSNLHEICSEIKLLFKNAVKKRLNTDLPVAVMLSGGIDSALLLKYVNKFYSNVTAYCLGTEDSEDVKYSKLVADYFGIPLKVVPLDKKILIRNLEKYIYFGESFEPNLVNTLGLSYELSKAIHKDGIKIAFSGEGADELFGGYSEFLSMSGSSLGFEIKRFFDILHRTQLQRIDRMFMANRVEVRVPFLDKDFASYIRKVESKFKIRDGVSKWILRKTFERDLPSEIIWRKKSPFPVGANSSKKEFDKGTDLYSDLYNNLNDKYFFEIKKDNSDYRISSKEEAFYFLIYSKFFSGASFNKKRIGMGAR